MTIELEEPEVNAAALPAPEPDAPDELFDPALSRVVAAWQVPAAGVDVWTRVEAAIEKERNPLGFAAKTVAELGEQLRAHDRRHGLANRPVPVVLPATQRDTIQAALNELRNRERERPSLLPPPPPRPPTAIGAPAPAPDDRNDQSDTGETATETTRLLASAVRTLRDLAHEIADLRAEVADLRRERTRFVPRPVAGRLFPVAGAELQGRRGD